MSQASAGNLRCLHESVNSVKEANIIGDINLPIANFAIFSTINWFYRWYKPGGSLNEEEISDQMIKILLHGFLNSDLPRRGNT